MKCYAELFAEKNNNGYRLKKKTMEQEFPIASSFDFIRSRFVYEFRQKKTEHTRMCKLLLDINDDGENEIMNSQNIFSFHIITMQSAGPFNCSFRCFPTSFRKLKLPENQIQSAALKYESLEIFIFSSRKKSST